jgi:hypothetical protein
MVLGFEGGQLGQCFLLARLIPDPNELSLDIAALSSWDSREDIALLMHQTAVALKVMSCEPDQLIHPDIPLFSDEIKDGPVLCRRVFASNFLSIFTQKTIVEALV